MSLEKMREFEQRLRQCKPTGAPRRLESRISSSLIRQARKKYLHKVRSAAAWSGMALAACVLLSFGILLFNGKLALPDRGSIAENPSNALDSDQKDSFKPILAENRLTSRIDEGIVFLQNGISARQYRYEFIDRVVWKNPVDGATVEMEVPREEVILVPVQTF